MQAELQKGPEVGQSKRKDKSFSSAILLIGYIQERFTLS